MAPRCNRCQESFETLTDLDHHEDKVNCPLLCQACRLQFKSKEQRQAHWIQAHVREVNTSIILEIDECQKELIKRTLKTYSNSLKKNGNFDDHGMEQWIKDNTIKYTIGRKNPRAKLELGQWYILFRSLSQGKIPPQPCQ